MENYQNNHIKQRKLSSKNDRYNFNNLTNQACQSNNDILYSPTESNWNLKRKRKLSGISYQKNSQERFGFPQVYTSGCPHNTANLYLNKKNFSFKKKISQNKNNYYDKEKLYQNMMKLQTSLNILNQKYHKQKLENDKQAKEIERQNKFLNLMNEKNLKNMEISDKNNIYKSDYYYNTDVNRELEEVNTEENINKKEREQLIKNLTRSNESEYEAKRFEKLNEQKYNLNLYSKNNKLTYNSLKELYNELFNECKEREKLLVKNEKEKDKYKKENDILKVANETLISNLKRQMKRLQAENEKKDIEIKDLKKNIKCSRYTELLKENEVLNIEMEKLKNKLNDALKLINDYKKQEEEIKKLYEVIKRKDFKIKALELELKTLSNNSDETTKKLQDEIIIKDKLLKKQERDMKKTAFEKYALMQGQNIEDINNYNITEKKSNKSLEINVNDISNKCPELYQFYIEMKHKEIKSCKSFVNEVLKKISDVININDAKIIYCDLLLNYFNINNSDIKSRDIIINLASKEFTNNRSIHEIKNKHIKILNMLFNKNTQVKSVNMIKRYIDQNNLEEAINRTLMELDKKKLGHISFAEMKTVINEIGLHDFLEEILLLTKSEIFNRIDYYNLLVLFNSNNNNIDINKYVQIEKSENNDNIDNFQNNNDNIENNNNDGIHNINNNNEQNENNNINNDINNNNNNNINNNNNDINNNNINDNNADNNNNNIDKVENNNNNNANNNDNVNDNNEENKLNNENENKKIENDPTLNELEKKLKVFVNKIKVEGASPVNYISQLKESINIDNNSMDVINVQKLKEFLNNKKIELNEDEINLLQKIYNIGEVNNDQINAKEYINYDMFTQKLLNIIQNISDNNDENFLDKIPVMEIGGIE